MMDKIKEELKKQDEKWGEQNHEDLYWLGIAGEEYGEISKSIIENDSPEFIKEEIIQLAAVCVQWLKCIERRSKNDE